MEEETFSEWDALPLHTKAIYVCICREKVHFILMLYLLPFCSVLQNIFLPAKASEGQQVMRVEMLLLWIQVQKTYSVDFCALNNVINAIIKQFMN